MVLKTKIHELNSLVVKLFSAVSRAIQLPTLSYQSYRKALFVVMEACGCIHCCYRKHFDSISLEEQSAREGTLEGAAT